MVAVIWDQSTSCPGSATRHIILIRLQQRPLLGLLVNPFGTTARSVVLDGDHLMITRRGQPVSVSLAEVREAPMLRKGGLGTTLSLQVSGHEHITLRGAAHADASAFAESVKSAWFRFNTHAFDREAQ